MPTRTGPSLTPSLLIQPPSLPTPQRNTSWPSWGFRKTTPAPSSLEQTTSGLALTVAVPLRTVMEYCLLAPLPDLGMFLSTQRTKQLLRRVCGPTTSLFTLWKTLKALIMALLEGLRPWLSLQLSCVPSWPCCCCYCSSCWSMSFAVGRRNRKSKFQDQCACMTLTTWRSLPPM